MKIKPLIGLALAGLLILGSYSAAVAAGRDPVRLITEGRCISGAFLTHATNVGAVAADSDTADQVSINNLSAPSATDATTLLGSNIIANPGFDLLASGVPKNWRTNVYGTNNASFSTVSGYNSPDAARVQISNYTNGDGDWYYDAVPVSSGQYYQFSDYYRSNVTTRAILGITDASGATQYINLASTPASSSWTKYSVNFFIPQNIVRAVVFHPLAAAGWLETDSNSLTQAHSQGFNRALVSVTFDDGWKSIHDNALPVLKQDNLPSTQYLISGYIGNNASYMTAANVYDFVNSGSEVASHTVDHVDLTKQSAQSLQFELARSKSDLTKCFGSVTDFADPLGTYNAVTEAAMAESYATARSTDVGFNTADSTNPYALKVQNVSSTTTSAQLSAWIETAKSNHVWLILVYHQIDSSSGQYARTPQAFASDMQTLKASEVKVATMHDAYAEIKPQLVQAAK